jgi:hypothetical protein
MEMIEGGGGGGGWGGFIKAMAACAEEVTLAGPELAGVHAEVGLLRPWRGGYVAWRVGPTAQRPRGS